MARDFYELLGVPRNATEEEIKRAYRRLARELHPDTSGDAESEARFKEVTAAYETLRDPERRRQYDMFGTGGERFGQQGPGDVFTAGFGDLFNAFFSGAGFGGSPAATTRRGEDVEVTLDLPFEEAVFGVERPITFRGVVACATCSGTGARPGTSPVTCTQCGGTGQQRRVRQSILGQVVSTTPCNRCRGLGEVIESRCSACRGDGRRVEERTITVDVPCGVDNGTTLRITGAGAPAVRGGVPGDLYAHVQVAPHPRFERTGIDLVTAEHVTMAQAALGTDIEVETLDGTETISVPPGTQTGRVVRLRGRGVPEVRGHNRGDLHVQLVVDTPTGLSKDQERLLREFAAQRGEELASEEPGLIARLRAR
ncbi:MAG: molecular chaperone DnaJ [Acidimicrobiales bacterium]|jgi:molecular chaperone DnaJ